MANAASYNPAPMASPSSSQAANSWLAVCTWDSNTRPSAKSTLVAMSTGRPPQRSISRPATGPVKAITSSASENAAKTRDAGTPRLPPIAPARMAGR